MIIKNCKSATSTETIDMEHILYHTDSCNLNMTVSTNIIGVPNVQECGFTGCPKGSNLEENCSLSPPKPHQQPQENSQNMNNSNMKLIEKFSELSLENFDDTKPTTKEIGRNATEIPAPESVKNCIENKALISGSNYTVNDSCHHLPEAKISLKANKRDSVCLSCINKTCYCKFQSKQVENIDRKIPNLSLTELLISRSPDKRGRKHCKSGLPTDPTKEYNKLTIRDNDNTTCLSNESILNINGFSSVEVSPPTQQFLHGCGGTFTESVINTPEIKKLYSVDQNSLLQSVAARKSPDCTYGQLSPTYDMSPSSIRNESHFKDFGASTSLALEFYPTPPHSAFESTLSPYSNGISSPETAVTVTSSDLGSEINIEDESLLSFSSLEEILTSDVCFSPLSENTCELDVPSPSSLDEDEGIKKISWFLKNGNVNPAITQLVTDCSERFSKAADINSRNISFPITCQDTRKQHSIQQPLFNHQNNQQSPAAAHCCSSTFSHPSTCASVSTCSTSTSRTQNQFQLQNSLNNATSSTVLLMPIHLQTVAVSGIRDKKYHREIKPKSCPSSTNPSILSANEKRESVTKIDNKSQTSGKINQQNSKYHNGYKSVKQKISLSMSREQKNYLLKIASEEQFIVGGEPKLHSAVLSGDEQLAYVIIESMRTQIKTNNYTSYSRNVSNPRLAVKEKIQEYVNIRNSHGCTPLYYAVLGENNDLTAYLLECGADPLIKDNQDGNTSFHVATVKGDDGILSIRLLSFCRNIYDISDVRNNKRQTVLISAVINHGKTYKEKRRSGIKLIKYLLKENYKRSSQDSEGKTALHIAVLKKDLELLEVLLTHGSDGDAKLVLDNEGNSILHLAAKLSDIVSEKHIELIWLIIKHCPELTEVKNKEGKVPYELINENRRKERDLLMVKFDELGFKI